ncbi:hypothetical protein [Rhizobium mongolense]
MAEQKVGKFVPECERDHPVDMCLNLRTGSSRKVLSRVELEIQGLRTIHYSQRDQDCIGTIKERKSEILAKHSYRQKIEEVVQRVGNNHDLAGERAEADRVWFWQWRKAKGNAMQALSMFAAQSIDVALWNLVHGAVVVRQTPDSTVLRELAALRDGRSRQSTRIGYGLASDPKQVIVGRFYLAQTQDFVLRAE